MLRPMKCLPDEARLHPLVIPGRPAPTAKAVIKKLSNPESISPLGGNPKGGFRVPLRGPGVTAGLISPSFRARCSVKRCCAGRSHANDGSLAVEKELLSRAAKDPGSATHHCVPHRVRDDERKS